MIWLLGLVAVGALGVIVYLVLDRPRQEPGVVTFRRHIDALSVDSRRESMDRVRRQEHRTIDDPGMR